MEAVSFGRGLGTSLAFWRPERDLACVVHGDDFMLSGLNVHHDWTEGLTKE